MTLGFSLTETLIFKYFYVQPVARNAIFRYPTLCFCKIKIKHNQHQVISEKIIERNDNKAITSIIVFSLEVKWDPHCLSLTQNTSGFIIEEEAMNTPERKKS